MTIKTSDDLEREHIEGLVANQINLATLLLEATAADSENRRTLGVTA